MKMVECMEDKGPPCPKGEIGSGVTQKNQVGLSNGSKGCNKRKWGQGKLGPPTNKDKSLGKELLVNKAK
jgi:hypothetical protein